MGLFSKLGKNKQETAGQDSGYYTSADDQAATERARAKRASSADGAVKSRRARDREADDPVLPEKKRARRRLVGAIALALAVAVGLPMVLDSEPRPLASDIDIKIPARDKPAEAVRAPAASVAASAALDGKEEIVDDVKPARAGAAPVAATPSAEAIIKADNARQEAEAKAELKAEAKAKAELEAKTKAETLARARSENEAKAKLDSEHKREAERKLADSKAEAKAKADAERKLAEAKSEAKAAAKPDGGKAAEDARALAILEGKGAAKPAAAAESGQKFVLQVAALSDQGKVDELRKRLKEAGINSFTQKTPSGEITRVRVGPFSNKEEAEKVRAKLSGMGLSGRLETV